MKQEPCHTPKSRGIIFLTMHKLLHFGYVEQNFKKSSSWLTLINSPSIVTHVSALLRFETSYTDNILRMQCCRSTSARCLRQGVCNFRVGWSASNPCRQLANLGPLVPRQAIQAFTATISRLLVSSAYRLCQHRIALVFQGFSRFLRGCLPQRQACWQGSSQDALSMNSCFMFKVRKALLESLLWSDDTTSLGTSCLSLEGFVQRSVQKPGAGKQVWAVQTWLELVWSVLFAGNSSGPKWAAMKSMLRRRGATARRSFHGKLLAATEFQVPRISQNLSFLSLIRTGMQLQWTAASCSRRDKLLYLEWSLGNSKNHLKFQGLF